MGTALTTLATPTVYASKYGALPCNYKIEQPGILLYKPVAVKARQQRLQLSPGTQLLLGYML